MGFKLNIFEIFSKKNKEWPVNVQVAQSDPTIILQKHIFFSNLSGFYLRRVIKESEPKMTANLSNVFVEK